MVWPEGRSFEGEFEDGKPNGKGIMKWSNKGKKYVYS